MSTQEAEESPADVPLPPTIYLPSGCKPSKAASRDELRPALTHAYLTRRGDDWWVCTTDSYIAAAIMVHASGDVQEGWIPRAALRLMERHEASGEQISTTAWKVRVGRTTHTVEIADPGKAPDLAVLGMWDPKPGSPLPHIGMDPALTVRLQKALNGGLRGLKVEFATERSAMRVTGGVHFSDRRGLQMPVRLDEKAPDGS